MPDTRKDPSQWAVAVMGEVLFDLFPDGPRLGGAPFNVAWHLTGFGVPAHFVSRVGDDALATAIVDAMVRHGMDTSGLQSDPVFPTGRVNVTLDGNGGHRFEICPDQAYDHIDGTLGTEFFTPELIYYGTLALRGHDSRTAILDTVDATTGMHLLDINLRDGCWTNDTLESALARATVVKLNDDELDVIAEGLGLHGSLPVQAARLREAFNLEAVCITAAEEGAHWLDNHRAFHVPAPPVTKLVDTVGAGDGFSAVLAYGLMAGWEAENTLTRAAEFASAICGQRGACPEDASFYKAFRENWGLG